LAQSSPALKTADILTAQQVPIRFELAGLRDRGLAQVIDTAVWIGVFVVVFALAALVGAMDHGVSRWFVMLTTGAFVVGYSFWFELFWRGQTPGKRMMGLQVVKRNGDVPGIADYATRWAFRLIDAWGSLGALAALLISTSDQGQRVGDMIADTLVVRRTPYQRLELQALLRMHDTEKQPDIQYPNASLLFREADMLLALRILDRYRKHPNAAHHRVLHDLAERLRQELGLPPGGNAAAFIERVIRDYVTLTR